MCLCLSDLFLIVLSVLFPPLPVWIRRGCCSADSFINVALFFLGYFPGLIHSWYIIARYPPYSHQHKDTIYYVYRSDLENQTPRRKQHRDREDQHHHHHHHHCHNEPNSGLINNQHHDDTNYGAVIEGSSSSTTANNNVVVAPTESAPPAYSEFDNKAQRS
ncbi:PMP3 Plasma membrane proteolipid 3 [Candida maltosa Xu316]|uniref:Stress response RCI peptide n=1 Tax=Candida maltosa (strain Xu316) TaxID=1245528 RepID=M3HR03_CANMX|nr:hypothetical protein G210_5107 [Candida maltosa Xu316]